MGSEDPDPNPSCPLGSHFSSSLSSSSLQGWAPAPCCQDRPTDRPCSLLPGQTDGQIYCSEVLGGARRHLHWVLLQNAPPSSTKGSTGLPGPPPALDISAQHSQQWWQFVFSLIIIRYFQLILAHQDKRVQLHRTWGAAPQGLLEMGFSSLPVCTAPGTRETG